jgi:hypothetical protein
MSAISLSRSSVLKGEPITLRLTFRPEVEYGQMQVEVFTAGVANPSNALGFGTVPQHPVDGQVAVDIDTQHLRVGVYEIGLVRLHSPTASSAAPQLDFVSGRDFPRQVFEVREPADSPRTPEQLLTHVVHLEQEHTRRFTAVVDVREDRSSPGEEFAGLVFVRDILVGVGMRFDHFEIVPTNTGLDTEDAVRFVNTFLQERTVTGIAFEYDVATRENARRTNPVCVLHFPAVLAKDVEAARDYCAEKANTLLLALSLSRDAGGVVFEIVLVSRKNGQAVKYGIASPYVGNLLTGGLSGENFESVRTYLSGITVSDTNRFLVSLYREARGERSRDFQYVRLWQILETMAEGRNYDASVVLCDYAGNPMTDNGQVRLLRGSVNTVFNLFREEQVGDTGTIWKHVNIWFAFRNAVAHHGAISRYESLSRESVREWARIGHEELQRTPDHDGFLWMLKEDVKLLLMRQLVMSARDNTPSEAALADGGTTSTE